MQKTMLNNRPIKPRYHGDIELIARDMNVHRDSEKAVNSYNAIVL